MRISEVNAEIQSTVLIMFLFFLFYNALASWGPLDLGRDCPSQGWLIPRDSTQLADNHDFEMQTHQTRSRTLSQLLYQTLTYQVDLPLSEVTPGPGLDN